jgi:glucose-6-phosphate isomerase
LSKLTESSAWRALTAHQKALSGLVLSELFARDPKRAGRYALEAGPLFLDYSRHLVTDETFALLIDLAQQQRVAEWREKMFGGERINSSEDRAALHTALRDKSGEPLIVGDADVRPAIRASLAKMRSFSEALRRGEHRGATGKAVTDVVCIGIGGSDAGPRLVCQALQSVPVSAPRVHFIANLGQADFHRSTAALDGESTIFVVASKSFETEETLANGRLASAWLARFVSADDAPRHMFAVTARPDAALAFGIPKENCFASWDWVGGRFSVWSAVGLPIAIACGMKAFEDLLGGAHEMDRHFRTAPLQENMPVVLALLGIWYRNFWHFASHAVVGYSHALGALTEYLQQLEMESNGKSVDRDGNPVDYATAPVVWGGTGTVAQHTFFQWLHQGTDKTALDLIAVANNSHGAHPPDQQSMLAHFAAQGEGLAFGATSSDTNALRKALRSFAGNRPSSSLVMDSLDARNLGALLALYEHKVFVQGVIWNINPFDQWGVELGKSLAHEWQTKLSRPGAADDSALLRRLRRH